MCGGGALILLLSVGETHSAKSVATVFGVALVKSSSSSNFNIITDYWHEW